MATRTSSWTDELRTYHWSMASFTGSTRWT